MAEENENITDSGGKRTKAVMVRLPRYTAEAIDEFAGDTHSSRPDFIIDATRQYISHLLSEAFSVTIRIEPVDVSDQAKDAVFYEEMGRRMFPEVNAYKNAKEGSARGQDVSVLVSMPNGLRKSIAEIIDIGLFFSNQELIKTAVHWLLSRMDAMKEELETVSELCLKEEGNRTLDKEIKRLMLELNK